MQSLVDEKRVVFAGIHDEHYIDPKANLGMYEIAEHVNKANQKLIQHTIVRGWLDEDMKKRPADETSRLQKLAFQAYGESPSVVPQLEDRDADFQLEKYALGRRFFITEKGYMGLAPVGAQTGDIIVVLFGSHVPFILRGREAGDYEVVGETYVSGIMKGEVLKDLNEGKCEANRFMLV
ncbi:hypothetical protein N0V92_013800 [Colletotrichum tropicale]|nr:hypothetical protein N0V92_013800 [Colletotrichum tropicale]